MMGNTGSVSIRRGRSHDRRRPVKRPRCRQRRSGRRTLTPAAQRALAEAEARRKAYREQEAALPQGNRRPWRQGARPLRRLGSQGPRPAISEASADRKAWPVHAEAASEQPCRNHRRNVAVWRLIFRLLNSSVRGSTMLIRLGYEIAIECAAADAGDFAARDPQGPAGRHQAADARADLAFGADASSTTTCSAMSAAASWRRPAAFAFSTTRSSRTAASPTRSIRWPGKCRSRNCRTRCSAICSAAAIARPTT